MASFSGIEIKRELRPCLVGGEPALFHMWEERSDVLEPSPLVGGHNGGILRYTLGVVEMENGQIREVAPHKIQFTDQKTKEYCFEPEGSSQEEKDKTYNVERVKKQMIKLFKKYYGVNWNKAPYLVEAIELLENGGTK